jgi:thiol-disulfide isomerase/thioredoxin
MGAAKAGAGLPGRSVAIRAAHAGEDVVNLKVLRTLSMATMVGTALAAPSGGGTPSFDGATAWLNSPRLTSSELRGKVVLVDFWTYSCINWRREFPYVKAWAAKYKARGLVVIGVHAPEFAFEKNLDNVKRAVMDIGVDYPVAVDSEQKIWRAFSNAYWPALYFIDAKGKVRHHHYGEGDYAESERVIQRLLSEINPVAAEPALTAPAASGAEAPADWGQLQSPENYVGYARTSNLAATAVPDKPYSYKAPAQLPLNHWAPDGEWTLREEAAVLQKANGRIVYRFHARDLHLVMGPASDGKPVRFRISIDGKPPGASHGVDVDEAGQGSVSVPRMYQLIRQSGSIGDRRFEIEFMDPGVEVYSFTFG